MSRPPAKSGLNSTTERELVWWTARGLGPEEAAKRAGLPSTANLYRFRRTAAFADDLRAALKDHMAVDLAPKAIQILSEIMCDVKMPGRVRVDAAKTLLDRAGFTPAAVAADAPPIDDDMSRWSVERLQAFVAEGERKLAREEATDADFEVMAPTAEGEAPTDGAEEGHLEAWRG